MAGGTNLSMMYIKLAKKYKEQGNEVSITAPLKCTFARYKRNAAGALTSLVDHFYVDLNEENLANGSHLCFTELSSNSNRYALLLEHATDARGLKFKGVKSIMMDHVGLINKQSTDALNTIHVELDHNIECPTADNAPVAAYDDETFLGKND